MELSRIYQSAPDQVRLPSASASAKGRSKVGNGSKLLAGVDGRSHLGRRLHDIVRGLLVEFPVTSEGDLALVKATAGLTALNEQLQAKLALGELLDPGMLMTLSGHLRRNLAELRERTGQRGPAPPSIHEHVSLFGQTLDADDEDPATITVTVEGGD